MNDQMILAVDENGRFSGHYIPKTRAHAGEGTRHLAITVFLFNSHGEILLQRRRHEVFDNVWDNTGSTHQLHLADGHDETDEEAARRCLHREWGIEGVPLVNHGGFNYFARDGARCENEHCKVLTGVYDGAVHLNPEIAYEYRWLDRHALRRELAEHPASYSPWCVEAARVLEARGLL